MPRPERRRPLRSAAWGLAALAALAWLGWPRADAPVAAAPRPASAPVAAAPAPAGPPAPARAPFSADGARERQAQRALWQQRLARAEEALEVYRVSTRYPHDSQPLDPRSDQADPHAPIVEERRLEGPGEAAGGPVLQTTQERVFVQGAESVRFTLALRGADGQRQPLRVLRASARELTEPGRASLHPEVPLDFNDDGRAGDVQPGDGVHGVQLQPQAQGFAGLSGPIRVAAVLRIGERESQAFFDLLYTDRAPAAWQGAVREAMEDGSLVFGLPVDVREPGRYVVSARVVDARGTPFALLGFNEEVGTGAQEFRLVLFGRLVRDVKPAFPVALRDVTAFLLHEEGFPDRSLMPRRDGTVHVSQDHPLDAFGESEWRSEERSRYLDELGRDVARARTEVERLGP
jgi:hypothetical protein